jgi:hypothetical protein
MSPVMALASDVLSELLLPQTACAVEPDCELVPSSQLADELLLDDGSSQEAALVEDVLPASAEANADMEDISFWPRRFRPSRTVVDHW